MVTASHRGPVDEDWLLIRAQVQHCSECAAKFAPVLVAALEAVLALHVPEEGQHPDFCGADLREMPCPTRKAVATALRDTGAGVG